MAEKRRCPAGLRGLYDTPAPGLAQPLYERYHITPGDEHRLICVSSRFVSIRTHYLDGRTTKCTGQHGACWYEGCSGLGGRWGAWIAVNVPGDEEQEIFLVTVTKVTVRNDARLRNEGGSLRGLTIGLKRKGKTMRTRLTGRILDDRPRVEKLPPEPDLYDCIERMLSAADRHKDQDKKDALDDFRNTVNLSNKIEARATDRHGDQFDVLIDQRNEKGFDPRNRRK